MRHVAMLTTRIYFTMDRDDQCVAVSFCDVMTPIDSALRFVVQYYGPSDADIVTSHVYTFLRDCSKSAKSFSVCYAAVFFDNSNQREMMNDALKPVLGTRLTGNAMFDAAGGVVVDANEPMTPLPCAAAH